MKSKILSGILFVTVLLLCYKDATLADSPGAVITLNRGGCYGQCPIYKLAIYSDGKIVYEGEEFVKVKGIATGAISKEKLDGLISEFYKINYFSLKDSYEEMMATDAQTVITSINIDGKAKSIRHYFGDKSAPEELSNLEVRIDEIANSAQWVK